MGGNGVLEAFLEEIHTFRLAAVVLRDKSSFSWIAMYSSAVM